MVGYQVGTQLGWNQGSCDASTGPYENNVRACPETEDDLQCQEERFQIEVTLQLTTLGKLQ
jgi:hypothetical protein